MSYGDTRPDAGAAPETQADSTDRAEKDRWVLHVLGVQIPERGEAAALLSAQREMVRDQLQSLMADLRLLTAGGADIAAAQALFDSGVKAARANDFAGALKALVDCAEVTGRLSREAAGREATATVPAGTVRQAVREIELATALWATNRMRSIDGLNTLAQTLEGTDDPELLEIAGYIDTLTRTLPAELEAAITALRECVLKGDTGQLPAAKHAAEAQVNAAMAFLTDNAVELANCEENPWGIEIAVVSPLDAALQQIKTAIAAI
jgi:hypothetical protein